MSELIVLVISIIIFVIMANFTKQSAYAVCCLVRGAALILIGNWVLRLLDLDAISLNLFTASIAGLLGAPAIGFFLLISIFF